MKKGLRLFTLFVILTSCLALTGCAKTKISEKDSKEAASAFLTELFSFNQNQRYRTFAAAFLGDGTGKSGADALSLENLSKEQEAALQEYYRPFEASATKKCLEDMRSARLPLKYDQIADEKGISVEIDQLLCDMQGDSACTFEVTFRENEANEAFHAPVKGKVSLQVTDGRILIDSITIN